MSEEQPRKYYKASIEAGLHRLEQEKLSFLGNTSVISKFDAENLETYAAVPEQEEDETTVNDRDIIPSASYDGMRTMSDVQFVDGDVMIDANRSAAADTPTIDLEEHESQELSDVNTMVATNTFRQTHQLASGTQTLHSCDLIAEKDITSAELSLRSAQDVGVFAEAEDWDNSKTNQIA